MVDEPLLSEKLKESADKKGRKKKQPTDGLKQTKLNFAPKKTNDTKGN